ncbi:MFS transporter [Candidatus Parvarchaeota archaeon]|nr:MFS transporter [Candidatus Acidifodinimicrobium mancum]MBE5730212.1 MFS transporter [Candidatus Acidifodinimicrobium mancum]
MKNTTVLLSTKILRAFSVGFISIVLPLYLSSLGFSKLEVGLVFTLIIATSATFTMFSHRFAHFIGRRNSLMMFSFITAISSLIMFFTENAIVFVIFTLLSLISVNGTDIGPTFSLENAAFSDSAKGKNPKYFSIYNVFGGIAIAAGSLSVSLPDVYIKDFFLVLFSLSLLSGLLYLMLKGEKKETATKRIAIPEIDRKKINRLAELFSIDSFGGGFTLQAMIAYFFFIRFGLTESYLGYIFFFANVLVISSYFFSYHLSKKIGLVNTMVFTHLPSNVFLILIAFSPTAIIAVIFYLLRMSLAEMDVPPRQAYTMMVIRKRYRNKAAATTTAARMYTQSISPVISGQLMQVVSNGSPFIFGGSLKIIYDLLLFKNFRKIKTVSE